MLKQARVAATLPAQDLKRAKAFYAEKLGLTPTREEAGPGGGAIYEFADGTGFLLFESSGKPSGTHTQLGFEVDDVHGEVKDLKARGVRFEEYDTPPLKTVDGVAEVGGNKAAWFKDSEGNLIGIALRVTVGATRRA